jgi:hypothetical protein
MKVSFYYKKWRNKMDNVREKASKYCNRCKMGERICRTPDGWFHPHVIPGMSHPCIAADLWEQDRKEFLGSWEEAKTKNS